MPDHLQAAKDALIWGDGNPLAEDDQERLRTAAALATANALIALVERIDRLTINDDGSHSLDVVISGSVLAIDPYQL